MELKELPNTVVHCKTKDEYDRLMQFYEDAGWTWGGGSRPKPSYWSFESRSTDHECRTVIEVKNGFCNCDGRHFYNVITFAEFLKEQGIDEADAETERKQLISKFAVFTHDDALIQLWVRDGTAQIRKSGRRGKIFTVTGELDQWVKTFFEGYLSAA
jgi:hypothetical protein